MSGWTDYSKAQMFAIATVGAPPPTFYLALFSTSANPAGSPLELTLAGYARLACALVLGSADHATNAYDLSFGPLGAGAYTGVAILDAIAGGQTWFWDDEIAPITIPSSSDVTFAAGTLSAVRVP